MNTLSPFYKVDMSPIRFSLIEFSSMPPSWNSSLQILFVSEGELQLQANGILHELKAKDLAILSPMEIYSFSGGHGVGAIFEIDITEISTLIPDFALSNLQTLVTGSMHTSYAQHMRELLSDIIRLVISDYRKTLPLEYMSIAIRLLVLLSDYAKEPDQEKNTEKSLPLLKAIAFTAEHFREPISVKDAAAISQFSVPHFSKLFVAFIGSSYTEYVTELRLQEAERLLYTGMNITQIAEYCGFSDYRAFTRAYRKKYKLTPSESRKRILSEKSIETPSSKTVSSFVNQHLNLCLSNLSTDAQPQMRINYVQLPDTSLSGLHQEFTHSWQKSIGGGNAFLLLQSENQQLLRYLQENIGYEHIVLQNLLGDYMQVVSPSEQGELRYYFGNCDSVLDFVLSIGLKPIIQLGFMPSALAKHKPSKHSAMSISFSLPADNAQWQHFISAFLQHLFLRYGKNEVDNWEFHLWGKPDSYPMPFGIPDVDEYFEFYFATYQTIKSISTKIPFGSPAFLRDSCVKNDWLKRFFALCKKYKCLPDSLRFHRHSSIGADRYPDMRDTAHRCQ